MKSCEQAGIATEKCWDSGEISSKADLDWELQAQITLKIARYFSGSALESSWYHSGAMAFSIQPMNSQSFFQLLKLEASLRQRQSFNWE